MPTVTTTGSATAKAFGFTLGGAGRYFLDLLQTSGTGYKSGFNQLLTDISKTAIRIVSFLTNNTQVIISKLSNLNGSFISTSGVQTQSGDYMNFQYHGATAITNDSTGNAYIAIPLFGHGLIPYSYENYPTIVKVNSAGSIVAQYSEQFQNDGAQTMGMCVDSSNVYRILMDYYFGGYAWIEKFDLNLNLQNVYVFSDIDVEQNFAPLQIKTNTNSIFISGTKSALSTAIELRATISLMAKSNPLPTTFSKYMYFNYGPALSKRSLLVGGELNDSYIIAAVLDVNAYLYIVKFDVSTGNLIYAKGLTAGGASGISYAYDSNAPVSIIIKNDGGAYIAYTANNRNNYIINLDPSGNVIFARNLVCTTSTATQKIQSFVEKDGIFYLDVFISNASITYNAVLKVPSDGSLTQSFTLNGLDFSYVSASFSSSVATNLIDVSTLMSLSNSSISADSYTYTAGTTDPTVSTRLLS